MKKTADVQEAVKLLKEISEKIDKHTQDVSKMLAEKLAAKLAEELAAMCQDLPDRISEYLIDACKDGLPEDEAVDLYGLLRD